MALESRDISQKLRQTKCLLFNFWTIKLTITPILLNCQVPNGFFGITVNFSLQILKSKHLVCLSFWDISHDWRAKIYLSMKKMWALFKHKSCRKGQWFFSVLNRTINHNIFWEIRGWKACQFYYGFCTCSVVNWVLPPQQILAMWIKEGRGIYLIPILNRAKNAKYISQIEFGGKIKLSKPKRIVPVHPQN